MKRKVNYLLGLLLLLLLVACSGSSNREGAGASVRAEIGEGEVRVGEPLPTFQLTTGTGQAIDSEMLRGKMLLINFWATWCAPCRAEMPELQAAYEKYGAEGLEIVAIEIESSGSREESAAFLEEAGVSFPSFYDEEGVVQQRFLARPALPTSIFVDREGVVRFVQLGPMDLEFIEEQLDEHGF